MGATPTERPDAAALVGSLSEPALAIGADGFLLAVNDALAALLGVEPGALAGRPASALCPDGWPAPPASGRIALDAGAGPVAVDAWLTAVDLDGASATLAVFRPADARLAAAAALLELDDSAVVMLDAEGRHRYVSPSHERILGYPPHSLAGTPASDLIHPGDAAATSPDYARFIATPGASRSWLLRMRRADGQWRWIESDTVNRLHDPAVRAVVGASRDVTPRVVRERATAIVAGVARALAAAPDEASAWQAALAEIGSGIDADLAELWRPDPASGDLVFADAWHPGTPSAEAFRRDAAVRRFRPGEGLPGSVWARRELVYEPDTARSPNFQRTAQAIAASFRSAIGVPVTVNGEPTGALCLFLGDEGPGAAWIADAIAETMRLLDPIFGARQAAFALAEQEERFRSLAEDTRDLAAILGADGRVTYLAPTARAQLGLDPARMGGEDFAVAVAPEDRAAFRAALGRLAPGDAREDRLQVRLLDAAGQRRWFDARLTDLRDDPAVRGIVFQGRDVTERRGIEDALQASEERLAAFVANSPVIMFLKDAEGRYLLSNRVGALRVGHEVAGVLGRTDAEIAPPKVAAARRAADQAAREAGGPVAFTDISPAADGSRQILHTVKFPVGDAIGGVAIDITDRVDLEREIAANAARYRALTERSIDIVAIHEADGRRRYVTPAIERILGHRPEEWVAAPVLDGVHPDDLPMLDERWARLTATPGATQSGLYRTRRADGSWRWMEYEQVNHLDDPAIHGIVTTMRDVTDRVGMEHAIAAQLQREHDLRESEERFRSIIEERGDVVLLADADGLVRYASPSAEALAGIAPDRLIGTTLLALVHPEDRAEVAAAVEGVAGTDEGFARFESRILCLDGGTRWVEAIVNARRDDPVRPGVIATLRDVTDRRTLQDRLVESEAVFRSVFEDSNAGMALVDLEGHWMRVNRVLCDLLGYTEEEMLARTFADITHPDDIALDLHLVEQTMAGIIPSYEMEKRYIRRDGSVIWAVLHAALVRGADGRPRHIIAQVQDITARKRAEERLAFQARMMDLAYDAIFTWRWNGPILTWNRGAERMYGFSAEEAVGRTSHDLLRTRVPDGAETFQRALQERGAWEGELEHTRRDGGRITVETRHLLLDQPGLGKVVLEINRDVTARKSAESSLLLALAAAEEGNRLKDEFLATISHELRTPLQAIIGYTQLLLMGVSGSVTPEQEADLRQVEASSDHLLALIADLLDLSRIEQNAVELHFQEVDLLPVIHQACDTLAPQVADAGLTLDLTLPLSLPTVRIDPSRILQVLLNLLGNAVKFTPAGGHVAITAAAGNGVLTVAVRDTGVGISPEAQEAIFEPFRQEDATATRRHGGVGLGLSIARTFATLHGGSLTVSSAPGEGATFTLSLPTAG